MLEPTRGHLVFGIVGLRALEPLARAGKITFVHRTIAEIARDARRLPPIVPSLTVLEPQHHELQRRIGRVSEAAIDCRRTVEAPEVVVRLRRPNQRRGRRRTVAGGELVLRVLEELAHLGETRIQLPGRLVGRREAARGTAEVEAGLRLVIAQTLDAEARTLGGRRVVGRAVRARAGSRGSRVVTFEHGRIEAREPET
jgi:hypothetical protein